jgi:ATP synthase protein I
LKSEFVQDEKNRESLPGAPQGQNRAKKYANQTALAMELPFTLVGAVIFAGLIGFFLDKWLHTKPVFMLILGAVGFFAGVREVVRRLPDGSSSK